MAGAGYKLFNTGDVLTAQQVNEYLMQQTVMVFTDASARTTALSGVLAEGMLSYLKSDDKTYAYNGTSWVQVGGSSPLTTKGDLYTYSTADTRLASSAVNGDVLTVDTSTATGLKWAAPASSTITWTRRFADLNPIRAIAYSGSVYVAGGDGGTLYSSSNGTTWTSRTSGFGANGIRAIHWASGLSLFIAVGGNGTITTSPDGTTWTARTANMGTNQIKDVFSSGTTVVAVGNGGGSTNTGGITYSSDGITWTRKSQTPTIGTSYFGVTYNGTNWVVVGEFSTNNYLTASTPSGTWTAALDPSSGASLFGIKYDGTRTFYVDGGGQYYATTSTTLASSVIIYDVPPASSSYTDSVNMRLALYNGRIYQAGIVASDFSTTITNTNFSGGLTTSGFAAGIGNTSANANGGYFVGAAGRILYSNYAVYTSF